MKIFSYISRKLAVHILFFTLLTAGAWVFDASRSEIADIKLADEQGEEDSNSATTTYFCNPPGGYSIKVPVQKPVARKSLQNEITQKLIQHQTARAYHTCKAETADVPQTILLRHLSAFRYYHFGSPDDIPPVV